MADSDEGYLTFGTGEPKELSRQRQNAAMEYVRRAIRETSKIAIKFQAQVIRDGLESDDIELKKLANKASDSVLDRFLGKATQEIRVGETMDRPIVFSEKLRALNEAMKEAVDVVAREPGRTAGEALASVITDDMTDRDGVVI